MKKQETNPSWLTPDALAKGLTPRVISYLSGKRKNLSRVKDFTWEEFFFIYSSEGNAFEQSTFFKKTIEPFVSMNNTQASDIPMRGILGIIDRVPEAKAFFRDRIPVPFAIRLCDSFWSAAHLWGNAKNKPERRLILDKCLELFATCTVDKSIIKTYWDITSQFPDDRKIVQALIGSLIAIDTYEAYLLAKEIPFTDNQMQALVDKIEKDKSRRVSLSSCLTLYAKTKHHLIVPVLEKFVSEETSSEYVFGTITRLIEQIENTEREFAKKRLFPLLYGSLNKMGFTDSFKRNGSQIIMYLPAYEAGDPTTEAFLDEVIKYYGGYQYRLTYDSFLVWYRYAPKQQFIDLYVDGLGRHGARVFEGAIEVFKLIAIDSKVLGAVIEKEVPKLDHVNEDILSFVAWLEEQGLTSQIKKLDEMILNNNCLDKWLAAASRNQQGTINFLKLATRYK